MLSILLGVSFRVELTMLSKSNLPSVLLEVITLIPLYLMPKPVLLLTVSREKVPNGDKETGFSLRNLLDVGCAVSFLHVKT